MWLLDVEDVVQKQKLTLKEFDNESQVRYAVLSHTWGRKQDEVSFEDCWNHKEFPTTAGADKLRHACEKAANDNLEYIWIDTCCINKNSSSELQEAINSMYRWYQNSARCYAFLADIETSNSGIERSRWFTRGWTLQELIAPASMDFYDSQWSFIATRETLADSISARTGIHADVLRHKRGLSEFSIAQRMSWAADRQTTRVEDRAYSLFGIFGVHMSLLYGEGSNAFIRLQEELVKTSTDHSILAWSNIRSRNETESGRGYNLFASSPDNFRDCKEIVVRHTAEPRTFELGNKGLRMAALIIQDKNEKDRKRRKTEIPEEITEKTEPIPMQDHCRTIILNCSIEGDFIRVPCLQLHERLPGVFFANGGQRLHFHNSMAAAERAKEETMYLGRNYPDQDMPSTSGKALVVISETERFKPQVVERFPPEQWHATQLRLDQLPLPDKPWVFGALCFSFQDDTWPPVILTFVCHEFLTGLSSFQASMTLEKKEPDVDLRQAYERMEDDSTMQHTSNLVQRSLLVARDSKIIATLGMEESVGGHVAVIRVSWAKHRGFVKKLKKWACRLVACFLVLLAVAIIVACWYAVIRTQSHNCKQAAADDAKYNNNTDSLNTSIADGCVVV